MTPDISFIIPVYNCEAYLELCLKSIYEQKNILFECILINDGSTDASGSICDNLAQKYSNIKVIHKENGGVSSARNSGLEVAEGNYVTFVDSDDVINKMDFSFLKSEEDIYILGMQKLYNNKIKDLAFCNIGLVNNLIKYPIYMNSVCNKFFKKKFLEKYCIKFDMEQFATEDLLFFVKSVLKAETVKYVNIPYYCYRENFESRTQQALRETTILNNIKSYKKIKEEILKCNKEIEFDKFLRFMRIRTAIPYLTDINCFNPEKYRLAVLKTDIWDFDKRIDLTIVTFCAAYRINFILNIYIFIKRKMKLLL